MTIDDPDAPTENVFTVHRRPVQGAAAQPGRPPEAAAPIDIRKGFAQATKLIGADRDQEAAAVLRRVVMTEPRFATAWTNLGVAYRKLKFYPLAIGCYRRSLELAPNVAGTWSNLANAFKDLERFDEALACHRKALELDPKPGSYHHNYGIALKDSGDVEAAIVEFEKALAANPNHHEARWDLALSQLVLGNYRDGFANYEARWSLKEMRNARFPGERWRGQEIPGKSLLIIVEQGFGDTIMAARFAPLAARSKAQVTLSCQKEMVRLLEGMAGVDRVMAREKATGKFDYYIPLLSMIGMSADSPAALPPPQPLRVGAGAGAAARHIIGAAGDRLKVGIVWAGRVTFRGDAKRSISLDRFLSLADVPGVQLFSLQKGPPFEQFETMRPEPLVRDLGSTLNDFADTAAALRALDLVIMVDSAVAHLAGTLDVPVWTLIPFSNDWRWLRGRDDTPWYRSMRLFRQSAPGDWDGVFARLTSALAARVQQGQAFRPDLR